LSAKAGLLACASTWATLWLAPALLFFFTTV
jgi:hypothetical protein